jgi:hypothetical protein
MGESTDFTTLTGRREGEAKGTGGGGGCVGGGGGGSGGGGRYRKVRIVAVCMGTRARREALRCEAAVKDLEDKGGIESVARQMLTVLLRRKQSPSPVMPVI